MPTPLEIINAQRRGVQVYSPGRVLPQVAAARARQGAAAAAAARARPRTRQQRRAAGEQGPGVDWSGFNERARNSEGAVKARQKASEEEQKDAAYDELPWYKKGLGMVLGNPITRNALVPLNALGTLGKAVTLGVEEVAERTNLGEHIQDLPDWLETALKLNPATAPAANILGLVDTERTEADTRSNWEKLSPNSDYGFGQLLDPEMSPWLSRPIGFVGDVALDPTTYVTGGATRLAGMAGKGAKLAKAGEAASKADSLLIEGQKLARAGNLGEAAKLGRESAEHAAMARRLGIEAEEIATRSVPLRQGRKGRAQLLGEIAEENPELFAKHGAELTRGAERGFNTIKDPALREAIGLQAPSLRFAGVNIPGTERLTSRGAQVGGAVRAKINEIPGINTAINKLSAPRGLEEALGTLTQGAGGDPLRAATAVRIQNLMRRGAGNMEGRGNRALTDLVRQLKKVGGEDEIRTLFRQAEADPESNVFNKFFSETLPDVYTKVSGREMLVEGAKKNTYVPHMMTPQFKRFVKALEDGGEVTEAMGFQADDLLEGSHYLEKSRKLKPDTVGTPKDFDINGRTITLTDGTIDELNEELARAFPEFGGKAYMDDPIQIGEAYVSSVARQAGRDLAMDRMADSKNPLVQQITGELLEAVETRNAYLRQNPVISKIKEGYTAGQRLAPIKPKGDMPTTPFDDMFATTKHMGESQAARNTVIKEGRTFVDAIGEDVSKTRSTLAENLKGLRTTLMEGLKKKASDADKQIKTLTTQLERMDAEVRKIGPLSSENVDELVAVSTTVDAQIVTAKAEIKKIRDRYGKKMPRDQARLERELQAALRQLEEQAETVRTQYAKGSAEMRAEARRRKIELEEPVEKAQIALEHAEAAVGERPVSRQRVQDANAYVRSNFDTEDAFEAQRQAYTDALHHMRENNIPIMRTVDGRLTPETTEAVVQVAAEIKKATPPPAATAPAPAAAVAAPKPVTADALGAAIAKSKAAPEVPPAAAVPEAAAPEPPVAAAPEPPPIPDAPDSKLVKQKDGTYRSEDEWELSKEAGGWRIRYFEDDFGVHPTLKAARAETARQQQILRDTRALLEGAAPTPEPAAAAAATEEVVEAAPAAAERHRIGGIDKKNKLTDGSNTYSVSDGVDYYTIRKNDDGQWIVRTNGEVAQADNGYRTLQKAGEAIDSGKHRATAAPEPAAAAATEEVVEEAVPEPVAAAAAEEVAPLPKPSTQRITRRWTKKDFHGTEVETGPEGWTIEPYEESIRGQSLHEARGALEPGQKGPRLPHAPVERGAPAQGPRRARYIAYHDTDPAMSGHSFATQREAKLAVEDMLRRRQYKTTVEEHLARSAGRPNPPVVGTYENLSGLREFPPSALTPEEAQANIAASAGAPQLQRPAPGTTMGPNELALTPEGAALNELRPPAPPRNTDPYVRDYNAWQEMLARSTDPSLTKAERAKAKRTATSMGGDFTQTTGKHYNRHASEKIIIEDIAWQDKLDSDEAVRKARADYEREVAKADAQIEAMVYVKHNNPITGDEWHQRLPSGSQQGFGEGAERVPVQVKPPTQGEVPTGGRIPEAERPWRSNYPQGRRDADRAVLESGVDQFMMPENRQAFHDLMEQGQEIEARLDAAARNEADLRQADAAAKRAYTDEVKRADEAVAEAKRIEFKAEAEWRDAPRPGGEQAWEEAKRNTRAVIDAQTAARQRFMDADRAWKQALADRDEYISATEEVVKAEQRMQAETGDADKFITAAHEGRPTPMVANPKGGLMEPSETLKTLMRNMRGAINRVNDLDAAGRTFLTETQQRNLVGKLNSIDVGKREIVDQVMPGAVKQGPEILPMRNFEQERQEGIVRPDKDNTRFDAIGPTNVPPMRGTGDDLAARAFAESFNPTEPAERTVWSKTEEGALQGRTRTSGTRPYEPRTEREAIAALRTGADEIEQGNPALQQELGNIRSQTEATLSNTERTKAETELLNATERDDALAPLRDQVQTLTTVNKALHDKEKLIPLRDAAQAERKVIVDGKVTKKADVVRIANDIESVAKANPELLDTDLATTEALLHDARIEATRVNENDLTAKEVQKFIDKVSQKGDTTVDVMLTTVGRNWKMLYDANGTKKAILKEGNIIVQAELHRMFTNLYEIKKDPVWLGRTLNAFTNLFKTYATLSPGFHVRNAISAVFMNATDGVALKTQYHAAGIWREYMKADDPEAWLAVLPGRTDLRGFTGQQVHNAFTAAHGTGAGGRFSEAGFAEVMDSGRWLDKLEKLQRNRATRLSQRAGQRVEGSVRLAMALDSMRLGEDIESAIQRINRVHFDYSEVSRWDENMKRVVPFWTFMSRNMPMQVSQMWTHPRTYMIYEDFRRNMSSANEEYTPEYWTKAGAFNTGVEMPGAIPESFGGGLPIYAAPDLGFNRLKSDLETYEQFLSGKNLGGVLSQGNPWLTAPLEFATRQDIFTGQKFEEGETVPAGGLLGFGPKLLAMATGQAEGGEVDAAFMNMIRAVNPLQDRSSRLLPQLSGGDPEAQKRQIESWARFIGVPGRTLTPKQQDSEMLRRYYDQLNALERQQDRERRRAG